jgi:hypothetical protein
VIVVKHLLVKSLKRCRVESGNRLRWRFLFQIAALQRFNLQ